MKKPRLPVFPLPTVFSCTLTTPPNLQTPISNFWLHVGIFLQPPNPILCTASLLFGLQTPALLSCLLTHQCKALLYLPSSLLHSFSLHQGHLHPPGPCVDLRPPRRLSSPHLLLCSELEVLCQSLFHLPQPTPGSPATHTGLSWTVVSVTHSKQ